MQRDISRWVYAGYRVEVVQAEPASDGQDGYQKECRVRTKRMQRLHIAGKSRSITFKVPGALGVMI
jgi:hypothetical protein